MSLPADLLLHCFEFLSIRDLECGCAPVNKVWALTRLANSCWQPFCVWNFGVKTVCSGVWFSPYCALSTCQYCFFPSSLFDSSSSSSSSLSISLPLSPSHHIAEGWWRLLVKQRRESDARLRSLLVPDPNEREPTLLERMTTHRPLLRIEQRCKQVVEFEENALDVLFEALVTPGDHDRAFSARCIEKIAESMLIRTFPPLLNRNVASLYCGTFTQEFKMRTPVFGIGPVPTGFLPLRCTSHWKFGLSLRLGSAIEAKKADLTPFFLSPWRADGPRLDLKGPLILVSATCHWNKVNQESDPPVAALRNLCSPDTVGWVQNLFASLNNHTESDATGVFDPASGVLFLRATGVTRTPRPMPNAPGARGYLLLFLSDNSEQLHGLFKILRQVNDGLGVFHLAQSSRTLAEEELVSLVPLESSSLETPVDE